MAATGQTGKAAYGAGARRTWNTRWARKTSHAEIVGFGSNADGQHTTRPEVSTMRRAMELALEDAGRMRCAIEHVNGHGTATEQGDIAETLGHQRTVRGAHAHQFAEEFSGPHPGRPVARWNVAQHRNDETATATSLTLNLDYDDPRCGELTLARRVPLMRATIT